MSAEWVVDGGWALARVGGVLLGATKDGWLIYGYDGRVLDACPSKKPDLATAKRECTKAARQILREALESLGEEE